jgi:hypothetical protein
MHHIWGPRFSSHKTRSFFVPLAPVLAKLGQDRRRGRDVLRGIMGGLCPHKRTLVLEGDGVADRGRVKGRETLPETSAPKQR